ncbi:MAG: S1 family peptidase [Pseudomonadota bacterium]|nr:S1 family peptidase [Pseudomonadota bacterium]
MKYLRASATCRALYSAALLSITAIPAHAIVGGTATESFAAVGAGVQLTPDWVLAAAHLGWAPGLVYDNGYGPRTVAAAYYAPGSDGVLANDLSLLRLVPLTDPAGGASAPLLPVSSLFVPYGSFAAQATTITSANPNIYPARGFAYSTVDESLQSAEPDGGGGLVTVNWLLSHDTRTYVESGDSGGALFAGHVIDSGLLLGITSAQIQDDAGGPIGSTFVQPAAYRDWIDATLLADTADSQAILWQAPAPVPEPDSAWLALGGLPLLAAALRRKRRRARLREHASV